MRRASISWPSAFRVLASALWPVVASYRVAPGIGVGRVGRRSCTTRPAIALTCGVPSRPRGGPVLLLGVRLVMLKASSPTDIDTIFYNMAEQGLADHPGFELPG
jgi:hypothetical protein